MNVGKCSRPFLRREMRNEIFRGLVAGTLIKEEKLAEPLAMPEVQGMFGLGTLNFLVASRGGKKLHEYVDQKHKELGPVFRHNVAPLKAIFVNSADEFRKIFHLEGPTPKHFLPEAWKLYNKMRHLRRGLLFMLVRIVLFLYVEFLSGKRECFSVKNFGVAINCSCGKVRNTN